MIISLYFVWSNDWTKTAKFEWFVYVIVIYQWKGILMFALRVVVFRFYYDSFYCCTCFACLQPSLRSLTLASANQAKNSSKKTLTKPTGHLSYAYFYYLSLFMIKNTISLSSHPLLSLLLHHLLVRLFHVRRNERTSKK